MKGNKEQSREMGMKVIKNGSKKRRRKKKEKTCVKFLLSTGASPAFSL